MLVSLDEFRAYMGGITLTAMEANVATGIISGVQGELENYLNRPVELVQIREIATLNDQGVLYLTVTPVKKILNISRKRQGDVFEDDVYLTPEPMYRDVVLDNDDRLWDKTEYVRTNYALAPGGVRMSGNAGSQYWVEYVGGLPGNHPGIPAMKRAILTVAARDWSSKSVANAGQRIGQLESTEVGDARFLGWSDDELKRLQRYRRRIVIR